jgi:galactoside O-acetyltransferase
MSSDMKDTSFLLRLAAAGRDVQIFANALILQPEKVTVEEGARIDDFARVEGGMGVSIGKYVHIASFASILGGGTATLGPFVGLAQGARVITGGGHPFSDMFGEPPPPGDPFDRLRGEVRVEAYAFVGANAVVLPNLTIAEGGVVAAGSVLTQDVPPWTIVAGSPARPVRERARFAR